MTTTLGRVQPGTTPSNAAYSVAAVVLAATLTALPVFLLGALAPLLGDELALGAGELGLVVAFYFGASAVSSIPMGRVAERVGGRLAMLAGAGISVIALLATAILATHWTHLIVTMGLAGPASALVHVGANLSISRAVPPRRQGLAFGIKQSAIPLSTLLAGLAVPIIGLTLGWRPAFVFAAVPAVLLPTLIRGISVAPMTRARPTGPVDISVPPLIVLGIAVALGGGAANSMGTFYVKSVVAAGVDPGIAGAMLAVGGLVGVSARILNGWFADRRTGRHLTRTASLQWIGGFGIAALALSHIPPVLVIATIVAFGAGWGWNGLFLLAVVRQNPQAPAAATGITQAGLFAGGFFGPLVFAGLTESISYQAAWVASGVALLLAGALVLIGRRMMMEDSVRRRDGGAAATAVDR